MSRYFGSLNGGRATVTRCGHRKHGFEAQVAMVRAGVRVTAGFYQHGVPGDSLLIETTTGYNSNPKHAICLSREQIETLNSGRSALVIMQLADNE